MDIRNIHKNHFLPACKICKLFDKDIAKSIVAYFSTSLKNTASRKTLIKKLKYPILYWIQTVFNILSKRIRIVKIFIYLLLLLIIGHLYYSFTKIPIYDYELSIDRLMEAKDDSIEVEICFPCLNRGDVIRGNFEQPHVEGRYFYAAHNNGKQLFTIPLANRYLVDSVSDYLKTQFKISCDEKIKVSQKKDKMEFDKYNILKYVYPCEGIKKEKDRWNIYLKSISLFKENFPATTQIHFNGFPRQTIFSLTNLSVQSYHFLIKTPTDRIRILLNYQVPVNHLIMHPEPDLISESLVQFYNKHKIEYIKKYGISMTSDIIPNREVQDARNIVIATFISVFISKIVELILGK